MKFLHLSDLHLGKRVNEFSMLDDQKYILGKILEITALQKPDAVVVAGDVYDKSVPSAEAICLFDDFLTDISSLCPHIFVISGNHDSPERIAFGSRVMKKGGIYLSPVYDGKTDPIELEDTHGKVRIYMLPFIKPANVRRFMEQTDGSVSYTEAVKFAIDGMKIDKNARNVLVTHQFVTGAQRSDSEEISIGGTDNVDASVFEEFDYVALGHLHAPQSMCGGKLRYCGSPLKYSLSEMGHEKSISIVKLGEKDSLEVEKIPLVPLRDMEHIKGDYASLCARSFYTSGKVNPENYMYITLTDENDVPDAMGKLRVIYPFLMKLDYDNSRTRNFNTLHANQAAENMLKNPFELFSEFFKTQNNKEMTPEQQQLLKSLIEKAGEEVDEP